MRFEVGGQKKSQETGANISQNHDKYLFLLPSPVAIVSITNDDDRKLVRDVSALN